MRELFNRRGEPRPIEFLAGMNSGESERPRSPFTMDEAVSPTSTESITNPMRAFNCLSKPSQFVFKKTVREEEIG